MGLFKSVLAGFPPAWFLAATLLSLFVVPASESSAQDDRGVLKNEGAPHTLDEMKSEARLALVIGNGAYAESPLKNPVNDAQLMARSLKATGFELVGGKAHVNLNKEQMQEKILEFGEQLRQTGGVGLFYFAGHGMQVGGRNYLIPIRSKIKDEAYVKVYAVDVGEVLAGMEAAKNRLNLVVLDACRNNPFQRSFRSTSRGLASMSAPSGTMMLYATRPGEVASDGVRNGPFTKALATQMLKAGSKLEDVLKRVVNSVEDETKGKQTPWQEGVIRGDFYFVLPDSLPIPVADSDTASIPEAPIPTDGEKVWTFHGDFGLAFSLVGKELDNFSFISLLMNLSADLWTWENFSLVGGVDVGLGLCMNGNDTASDGTQGGDCEVGPARVLSQEETAFFEPADIYFHVMPMLGISRLLGRDARVTVFAMAGINSKEGGGGGGVKLGLFDDLLTAKALYVGSTGPNSGGVKYNALHLYLGAGF